MQQFASDGEAFDVVIAASAPSSEGTLAHAVTVIQPVQTWTVIRSQEDFKAVGDRMTSLVNGFPACPHGDITIGDVSSLVVARNELQEWLNKVLLYPGAREAPEIRDFLTFSANMIPPQYENVSWTMFDANGQVASPAPSPPNYDYKSQESAEPEYSESNLDDMFLDDMFDAGDEGDGVAPQHDDSDDEDDYRPSQRYQPTDEPVTEEDRMDIAQMAGEVEMIEDVGSLAQSLGASHLGRSLLLQEEMAHTRGTPQPTGNHNGHGLRLGTAVSGIGRGGIGSAMANTTPGLGGSFAQTIPESPPRLDAFKILKVIGKGSFGKVFLVSEISTSQMFALKVLKKDNIVKRNQVEHTRTERSVLGYVKHPFIVGMHMAFQSRDKLYFVLDYCAGGELFFHLGREGRFTEARSRFYTAEIILAISYVHSLDIVYRDLKPENVLIDAMGHIRLTDFGLSKEGISGSSSGANSFCGTPEYLAPEILNRQGHGCAVDWWSLGALLYEMLSGLPPFYCKDRERLFEKIRKSELHYPASLSDQAKSVLRGLLTKDPNLRLGSGPKDADDIKDHAFFAVVNWKRLQNGEITPPWTPDIAGTNDTSQFDREFTSMPIFSPQSMQRGGGFANGHHFEGFTFQERSIRPEETNAST